MEFKVKLKLRTIGGNKFLTDEITISLPTKRELRIRDIAAYLSKEDYIESNKEVVLTKSIESFEIAYVYGIK